MIDYYDSVNEKKTFALFHKVASLSTSMYGNVVGSSIEATQ